MTGRKRQAMTRVLSFDPGYTTGVAVYDSDGELEASMAMTRKGLFKNGFLNHLVSIAKPDVVLVEALPTNLVSSEMQKIHGYIVNWFTVAGMEPVIIKPSQWKNLVQRVEIPGVHARDAATMARWFIKQNQMAQKDTENE